MSTEMSNLSEASRSQSFEGNVLLAAKGGGITIVGKLFKVGSRVVIAVCLARLLGAEQFGFYNLSLTVVEIAAGLAGLGMGTAMVRYIPHFRSRGDEAGLWGMLQLNLGIPTLLSLLLAIGLFVFAEPIAMLMVHNAGLAPYLRLVSLAVPFFTLSDMAAAATRGFKKMQYTVIAQNITQPVLKLVLILGLALVGLTTARALAATTVAEVVVALLLLYFLNRYFPLRRPLRAARRDVKEIVRFSLPVYLSSLINSYGDNIRILLLGAFSNVKNVGIFAVVSQVNLITDMFQGSIVTVSMPIIAELYSSGDRAQLGRFYSTMTKWALTLNLPFFLILALFPEQILAVFGKSFTDGAGALNILVWSGLVNTATGICGTMLDMTGNTVFKLVNSIATFALSVGLSLLLIPSYGLIGAAVAALAAELLVNLLRLAEVFLLFRLLPYNRSFIKPITAGLAGAAAALGVGRLLPGGASFLSVAIIVLLLLATYAGVLLLLGLSEEDRAVLARLRGRVGGTRKERRRW